MNPFFISKVCTKQGGYLAELETPEEHEAVVNLLPEGNVMYLLGANSLSDQDPNKFTWVKSQAAVPSTACWSGGNNGPISGGGRCPVSA